MMELSFELFEIATLMKMNGHAWDTPIGKVLYCDREIGNHINPCAVTVNGALGATTATVVSGHVPPFIR